MAVNVVPFLTAASSTPPQTKWFYTPQPLRPAAVVAVSLQRKPPLMPPSSITSTTGLEMAATQEIKNDAKINGKRVLIPKMIENENEKDEESEEVKRSWRDYFQLAKIFLGSSGGDGGPPRWFSPLESGSKSRVHNAPILLYLPGLDGLGVGLVSQQHKLSKLFDVWCLHIPVKDRTPFQDLVLLVEETVRSENRCCPKRPIYLVGESIGGCLALAVAARNPDIDLVLILANPATCNSKSPLQSLKHLFEVIPSEFSVISVPYILNLMTGEPLNLISSSMVKAFELQATLDQLFEGLGELPAYFSSASDVAMASKQGRIIPYCISCDVMVFKYIELNYLHRKGAKEPRFRPVQVVSLGLKVLANILPRDTLVWKLQMMNVAGSFAKSRLHAVKAQILILASGRDPLFPNMEEAERIRAALPKQEIRVLKDTGKMPKCEIRQFKDSGHFLFLENDIDLVFIIKGTNFYRRAKSHDVISDYMPPTDADFIKASGSFRWLNIATGPVMLSTLENGKIVRSLAGVPTEGPVLFVGYHMLLGLEIYPLVMNFMSERNILLRGLAHPMVFTKLEEDALDLAMFDSHRIMGAVPVTASNFYKLLSSGSHVLLYPGGMREALHKKGEAYQLFWPETSEFVRMAAKFGAKIVPFGAVGEDDICELILDNEDQMKIPFLRDTIERRTAQVQLRTDAEGEVANQIAYFPGLLPKIPGRFYYLFGKSIDTAVMKQELKDREKAHELYLQVKCEVESYISYLKEKREQDPYRSLAARTLYQVIHGPTAEVPTFSF